jgi:hypothetical protein
VPKDQFELVRRVHGSGLSHPVVEHRRGYDLIEDRVGQLG